MKHKKEKMEILEAAIPSTEATAMLLHRWVVANGMLHESHGEQMDPDEMLDGMFETIYGGVKDDVRRELKDTDSYLSGATPQEFEEEVCERFECAISADTEKLLLEFGCREELPRFRIEMLMAVEMSGMLEGDEDEESYEDFFGSEQPSGRGTVIPFPGKS